MVQRWCSTTSGWKCKFKYSQSEKLTSIHIQDIFTKGPKHILKLKKGNVTDLLGTYECRAENTIGTTSGYAKVRKVNLFYYKYVV